MRKGKEMKYKKRLDRGELGFGTKATALTDMKKDNSDFDDLDDMFCNEGRVVIHSPVEWDFDEIL